MASIRSEKDFQNEIIDYLVNKNGFVRQTNRQAYNTALAMDTELFLQFIKTTQPDEYEKLKKLLGDDTDAALCKAVKAQINQQSSSLIGALKKGVYVNNIKFNLMYRRPASTFNQALLEKYNQNIFSVMDEVLPAPDEQKRIDLVLFLNGFAIISVELKYKPQQSMEDAIVQFRYTRDPKSPLFNFKHGCLVNFAMDQFEVSMTTRLSGESTYFRPFNKGNGEGVYAGAGNPVNPYGYNVSYMWEDIFTKETLMDLITNFVMLSRDEKKDEETGKTKVSENLIFPRYHQLDAIRKILADVKVNGSSQNYLIQHSAGSGKTNTIAWLAHRLVSLYNDDNKVIFDTVIIVTDRVVVDRQLQNAVIGIDHQAGLIKVMDDSCNSDDLAAALNGNTKIIATTIQKFTHIIDKVSQLREKTFAVIIDEAHSSTAGAEMKSMSDVLGSGELKQKSNSEDGPEDFDFEDALAEHLKNSGKQPNLSIFAFTATPKPVTMELFGRLNKDGHKAAFHLYSMRQAIEEGYILDVLQNYTTYQTFYNIIKEMPDDPEVMRTNAKTQIRRFVELHPTNIRQRVEIIVEHFRENVAGLLNGRAKAMVVTPSREAAISYYFAFKKYIEEHNYQFKPLVAFSGKAKLKPRDDEGHEISDEDAKEFSESSINGFKEEALPEKFNTDEYQLLLVANKYQTGFDQPKLCAMYVLKKLRGVNAVQTLSRLNRVCPPFDKQVFVLDFANNEGDIVDAFEPFYTTTLLSQGISAEYLNQLVTELDAYGASDPDTVDEICELYEKALQTTAQARGKLSDKVETKVRKVAKYLKGICDEDQLKELKAKAGRFTKNYRFYELIAPFDDKEMRKRFVFWDLVKKHIETGSLGPGFSLKNKIKAERFTQQLVKEKSHPKLVSEPFVQIPLSTKVTLREDLQEKLSVIIQEVNAAYGYSFNIDAVTSAVFQIRDLLAKNEDLKAVAKNNTVQEFERSLYTKYLQGVLIGSYNQNIELFNAMLKNNDLTKKLIGLFIPDLFKMLHSAA